MAHFAQLDAQNHVLQVIVVKNDVILDEGGEESENRGIAFCKSLFDNDTAWVQTSYNGNFRKNYAAPGFLYDVGRDAFIAPQPYPSWTLNEDTCRWDPPVPMPENGGVWNEETQSWIES